MAHFVEWLQFRIQVFPWGRMPAFLWFCLASPLLAWCWGGPWFQWPRGCSRSPLRLSFWWVDAAR